MRIGIVVWMGALILSGCIDESNDFVEPDLISLSLFNDDSDGWILDYADYNEGLEDSMKFSHDYGVLHVNEDIGNVSAIIQKGHATNSDLFMFMKQQVSGLPPNSEYRIVLKVEFSSQLLEEFDAGGATSYGSFLKIGAFTDEPGTKVIPDPESEDLNLVVTDFVINKAHEGSSDIINLGLIEHTEMGADDRIVQAGDNTDNPFFVTTDADGKLWLMVGLDSNAPIYQAIYYTVILSEFKRL